MSKPRHFHQAKTRIPCDCTLCRCPAQGGKYSYMRVNEKHRFIYYSIPKAATSTIRKVFFNNDNRYSMLTPQRGLDEYFTFTMVRNPWSRMVSCYEMFTQKPNRIIQMRAMYDGDIQGFKHFVDLAGELNNHHWQPQVLFVPDDVDYIGKVETLESDLGVICQKTGMPQVKFPHLNRTSHRPYWEYYDEDTKSIVEEKYRLDIERFGYSFGE